MILNINTLKSFFGSFFISLNKVPFLFLGFFVLSFIMFNVSYFTETSSQSNYLQTLIISLFVTAICSIVFLFVINQNYLQKFLKNSNLLFSLLSFIVAYLFFGIFFTAFSLAYSPKELIDMVIQNSTYQFLFMLSVAFFEEVIFRFALVGIFLYYTKNNIILTSIISSIIFALFHLIVYDFSFLSMFFAFLFGLLLFFINNLESIWIFPTFEIGVAIHLTFNLYQMGVLSSYGFGGIV